ncbi:MAG: hypothetical protein ABJH05_15275 [Fulvivirga sp.]
MSIEQRKIELISWITSLNNEPLLNRMEELKRMSIEDTPKEILSLLNLSNQANSDKLTEHTTSRDILKNQ